MKQRKTVQELYTQRASFYDRLFIDFLGWGKELQVFFRQTEYLHSHAIILDAGCGTGIITRVLYQLAEERGYQGLNFHAFDLTESMLGVFRRWIQAHQASNVELRQADVLEIEALPVGWRDYDLIVSSTMLEYLPRERVQDALLNLKRLLNAQGCLLLIVTRRNVMTRWLAERWWKTNLYDENELHSMLRDLGFSEIQSRPLSHGWSGSIMALEARG